MFQAKLLLLRICELRPVQIYLLLWQKELYKDILSWLEETEEKEKQ